MSARVGVVILGMHRSGTSAVGGMFVSAGFFAGHDEDLMPPSDDNPAGYYENLHTFRANERILERLGASWFDPPTHEAQVAAGADAQILRAQLDALVNAADGMPVVMKDPRISIMMTLWDEAIGDRLHPVLVIRDPIEIAQSLWQRVGTPAPFGLAIWELYMAALLEHLDGREVTVAHYAALLAEEDRSRQLVSTAAAHIDPLRAGRVQAQKASAAIRPELRHNEVGTAHPHEHLTLRQRELWDLVASLPHGDARIQAPKALRGASSNARWIAQAETDRVATTERASHLRAEVQRLAAREHELAGELERRTKDLQDRTAELQHHTAELEDLRRRYLTVINSRRWAAASRVVRPIDAWREWRSAP